MFHLKSGISKVSKKDPKAGKKFFWFVLKSRNGKTLMTSEMYVRKRSAVNGIKAALDARSKVLGFYDNTISKTHFVHLNA